MEEPRTAYMIGLRVSKLVANRLRLVYLDVWMKRHLDVVPVVSKPHMVKCDLST